MSWILLALAASILWGLTYVIQEFFFQYIAVTTYIVIISFFTFIVIGIVGMAQNTLIPNIKIILSSKELINWSLLAITVYIAAELCIGFSINSKNATLAGLIEISYPLFITLFSLIIFRQNQLSLPTIVGGLFIASGVAVISIANK